MKKVCVLILAVLMLLPVLSVSAATVKESGASIIFHVDSPWFIYDGNWELASHKAEIDKNGEVYISLDDFRNIFKYYVSYSYDDHSIYVKNENHSIWQGLNTPVMFVDSKPYPNPAAYISSEGGAVMIPIQQYASVFGYDDEFTTLPTYAPGQIELTLPSKIHKISKIEINKAMQMVIIYGTDNLGVTKPIRYALCSTGNPVSLTPNGTFYARPLTYSAAGNPWYYFSLHNCWILYCTQISGNICFHSIPFNAYGAGTLSVSGYNAMGKAASHGCVRLMIEDAKFIWENCGGVPIIISDGYYDDNLQLIKNNLLNARPSYNDYVAQLKQTY